jgi:hypothetical protein
MGGSRRGAIPASDAAGGAGDDGAAAAGGSGAACRRGRGGRSRPVAELLEVLLLVDLLDEA